jgi:hypothetical protein
MHSDITLLLMGFSVNDIGEMLVDNITSTTFHVTCRNDPGAGGAAFQWEVFVGR